MSTCYDCGRNECDCRVSPELALIAERDDLAQRLRTVEAERDAARRETEHNRERRIEAIRDLAEGRTVIGAIWHALGIPADADADIVTEVRALVARDKPGCSQVHEELATVEAALLTAERQRHAMTKVVEAAGQLVECERLLIAQKANLGEEYKTCQHQTDLAAEWDAYQSAEAKGASDA